MGLFDWARRWFHAWKPACEASAGVIEKEFGVPPAVSRQMEDHRRLWWDLYTNRPPWETDCVRPLGLPAAIGQELARHALAEFSAVVSGSFRADYLNTQLQTASGNFARVLELGLCLGGIALKPYPENGKLVTEASVGFTPTGFDGCGNPTGGVFQEGPVKQGQAWFLRLESHGFRSREDGSRVYVVENRAFRSSQNGGIGAPVPLETVAAWADLPGYLEIENLNGPLFAYFKPPGSNTIDPLSPLGVSVYAGAGVDLLRQADQQWERLEWEYQSGERRIYADENAESPAFLRDRLFVFGAFASQKEDFFHEFSPEFRDGPLYQGFQRTLQRLEFQVGLAYGTLSDPQSVEKTATEILAAKHRQYVTEGGVQRAFQKTMDSLLSAMDALCSLEGLAPPGEYQTEYRWGDGVLDDPDARRQDMALDMQQVAAGLMNGWEFRVKWYGEDEHTARANLPKMETLLFDPREAVE